MSDTTAAAEVNPARAGMIRFLSAMIVAGYGKPRASGDDPDSPGRAQDEYCLLYTSDAADD